MWSVELFKNYLFGNFFTIITDHRALLSIMKEHRSKKSYNRRLTHLGDRLLPFDFNIEHIPGGEIGLVEYIARQSKQKLKVSNKYDEKFEVATISSIRDAAIYINNTTQDCQSQHFNSVNYTHSTRASIAQQKTIPDFFCLKSRHESVAFLSLCKRSTNTAFQ